MDAVHTSETSVYFKETVRFHITKTCHLLQFVYFGKCMFYARVSQPGFREMSLGVPREIVIEKINIVF
jgi:hypothetical protein